jgi:hypothetical protein
MAGLRDTYWMNYDNKTITLVQMLILTKDIEVQEINTDKLKPIVLNFGGSINEINRIENSDLQYPVLILVNDDKSIKYILDGNHRIQKSIRNDIPTIKVKLIQFSKLPNYVQEILGLGGLYNYLTPILF